MHKQYDLDLSGKTTYVYFMQVGETGPIKIGFTKNIQHRLSVIQVDNPSLVRLVAVQEGNRSLEQHQKFNNYRLYGEWFEPVDDLLNYISQFTLLNIVAADFQKPRKRGSDCHNWKGEAAGRSSKQQRARAHTRYKKKCDRCKLGKGLDTVYLDGNKDNLETTNIALYCRRCRMELDGTLEIIKNTKVPTKERPCKICGKITNRFWYDRCGTCNEFWRRNGYERSDKKEKESKPCIICGKVVRFIANGKCHTCYEFFRRNGYERTKKFLKDQESEDVKLLESFSGKMIMEKARMIRSLYQSGCYSNKFIAKKANISISYFNDIVHNRYFKDPEYMYVSKRISSNRGGTH